MQDERGILTVSHEKEEAQVASLYAQLNGIAERVKAQRSRMTNEPVTCNVSVMPFLRALGHDDEDARQVFPEFGADPRWSGGRSVDYAILSNDKPYVVVEAKSATVNLGATQWEQLYRYFNATDSKYGILTNGLIYEFYSDHDKTNIMDRQPFLTIDMLNLDEQQVADLSPILRSSFPPDRARDCEPSPVPEPDTFEYPIHAHHKGQRLRGMLLVDRVMNWHKQLILVRFMGELRAHTAAKSKAVQSIDRNGKSAVGAWSFWRFVHPVTGEDLPISEICLDVQRDSDLRKQLWESIRDSQPQADAIEVFGRYERHSFKAELLREHLKQRLWGGANCIRYNGEQMTAAIAALRAIQSVSPSHEHDPTRVNGLEFWHLIDPADGSDRPLSVISGHIGDASDDELRQRVYQSSSIPG